VSRKIDCMLKYKMRKTIQNWRILPIDVIYVFETSQSVGEWPHESITQPALLLAYISIKLKRFQVKKKNDVEKMQ